MNEFKNILFDCTRELGGFGYVFAVGVFPLYLVAKLIGIHNHSYELEYYRKNKYGD